MLVNAQTEKLFGYPREELLGQSVELLVPERFRRQAPRAPRRLLRRRRGARRWARAWSSTALRKDGTEFPIEISLSPLETEEGTLVSAPSATSPSDKRARASACRRPTG